MQQREDNDERVMALVEEAMELPSERRKDFLQSACQNAPELQAEVSEIIRWEERLGAFLRQPFIDLIDFEQVDPESRVFEKGKTVGGRFAIIGEIGQGGMGVVYEALDRKRNLRVALKCAKPGFGRLLSPELEGALKVRHPNICLVNEIHTTETSKGNIDFLTMEFLDGETLAARLERAGKLSEREALGIARQLCAGLAAAHAAGVLHRDLKTGNIILVPLEDGNTRVVITDFGLATEARFKEDIAGGTPRYMAPELWNGEKPTKASDVYALGVVLYEMLAGKRFPESNGERTVSTPVPIGRELDARWAKVILPCLAPISAARPDAQRVLQEFEKRAFWRSPALVVPVLAIVMVLAAFQRPILDFFKPADIRLAILPVSSSTGLVPQASGVLRAVESRIKNRSRGKASLAVIPLEDVLSARINTPEEAATILHATHVLLLRLEKGPGSLELHATLVASRTNKPVHELSATYAEASVGDIPSGVTGMLASALHLGPGANAQLASEARHNYERGLYFLNRDSFSYEDAIAQFAGAAALDPHSPLPLAALTEAYLLKFDATRDPEAQEQLAANLRAAEAIDADSIEVQLAAGHVEESQGNRERALEHYRRVAELDPQNIDATLRMAKTYQSAKMIDRAEEMFLKAVTLDPRYYKTHEELGAFYYYSGAPREKAAEQFREEIECAPGRVDGYNNLGGTLSVMGQYAEAEEVLRHSLRIRETSTALNNLGNVLAFQRNDQAAIPYYQKAISLRPENYLYWENLGDAQRRLRRFDDAQGSYRTGLQGALADLRSDPARGLARIYAAYLAAQVGKRQDAQEDILQALKSAPDDSAVRKRAVMSYEALGMRQQAFDLLKSVSDEFVTELCRHPDAESFCADDRMKEVKQSKSPR